MTEAMNFLKLLEQRLHGIPKSLKKNAQDNQFSNPNIPKKISPDTEKEQKTKETPQLLKAIGLTTKISRWKYFI